MKFWWVNQNQTFDQELAGDYLWSPKRKSNGGINPFYEFMRNVALGDLIFSFQGARIRAIGIARSSAYESPKPTEFGAIGPNWSNIGWRVDVRYIELQRQICPADHIELLLPFMQKKYAPLQRDGRGLQGVYLTFLTPEFVAQLIKMIGPEAERILKTVSTVSEIGTMENIDAAVGLVEWEEHLMRKISTDEKIPETEKEALIIARRGQGRFKENVLCVESHCRITKVDRIEHLRASHIKPWRDCDSDHLQRLDGENGFLLTPTIDHLFDRGFISFENSGKLIISPAAHDKSLQRMGIETTRTLNVGRFTDGQKRYLDFHRENVFLQAMVDLN